MLRNYRLFTLNYESDWSNLFCLLDPFKSAEKQLGRGQKLTMSLILAILRQGSAIFLLTLLVLVDSVTYGRLIFPRSIHGSDLLGIAIFLLSTAVGQFVMTIGSSFEHGVTASVMIESLPFIHGITRKLSELSEDSNVVLGTTMIACSTSTLITGLLFAALAATGLERLIHQFPRTVLVGSMGGIGVFLLRTSTTLTSSAGVFLLAVFCSVLTIYLERFRKTLFVTPFMSMTLFLGSYAFIFLTGTLLEDARELGWIVKLRPIRSVNLNLLSIISSVRFDFLLSILPTILGMSLFGLLHLPINVPSFSRSSGESFVMRKELMAHSYTNLSTALLGFLPCYLVYTNSVLFVRSGARGRITGLALSFIILLSLFFGTALLRFIPTVILAYLVFYLGLDLLLESVWFSMPLCGDLAEYSIILATILSMQLFSFLVGLAIGFACSMYLVVHRTSKMPAYIGRSTGKKNKHRLRYFEPAKEAWVQHLLKHSSYVRLHGYRFFGNSLSTLHLIHHTHNYPIFVQFLDAKHCGVDMNIREGLKAKLALNPNLFLIGIDLCGEEHRCFEKLSDAIDSFLSCFLNNNRLVENDLQISLAEKNIKDTYMVGQESVRNYSALLKNVRLSEHISPPSEFILEQWAIVNQGEIRRDDGVVFETGSWLSPFKHTYFPVGSALISYVLESEPPVEITRLYDESKCEESHEIW